jgi:hypothetical protein
MTVVQLLAGISSHELSEWQAYFIIKAEDEERARMEARTQQSVTKIRQQASGHNR